MIDRRENTNQKRKNIITVISVILIAFLVGGVFLGLRYSKTYAYASKLCDAIGKNDFEEFDRILQKEGDINSKSAMFSFAESNDMRPLSFACYMGEVDFVSALLEHGADPNLGTKFEVPLVLCTYNIKCENKMLNSMQELLQYGADPNYKNIQSISVLSKTMNNLSLESKKYSEGFGSIVLKLLVERGANFESSYKDNSILLDILTYKHEDFVEYLVVEKSANINVYNENLNTPLIFAVKANSKKSVEILLNKGANKDFRNNANKTALDFAQEKGNVEIIALLSQ